MVKISLGSTIAANCFNPKRYYREQSSTYRIAADFSFA